ncbi:MAG: outer membrane lipoprotein-sorting protein [Candidatus Electryonea clarkiae]|nr:outer membrane lipoprotein-sorting protein [Candidatus Electryonea clarkiae]MDP8289083.1 outer membrane lipoprotein-sorting protein [Candidatus Electryonea clarkiae]
MMENKLIAGLAGVALVLLFNAPQSACANAPTPEQILQRVDANMVFESAISKTSMTITNRRGRTTSIISKSWSKGEKNALVEYLAPARNKGTKMLMLDDELYTYSPAADRIIQISGHLLRQSVSGSDLSYEDMMENDALLEVYDAVLDSEEVWDGRNCFVLALKAKKMEIAYPSRKVWIDSERYLPLKEERYAKSGKLLKKIEIRDLVRTQNRWYPREIFFKDMLSNGQGTIYRIEEIQFGVDIPEHLLTKAALRR